MLDRILELAGLVLGIAVLLRNIRPAMRAWSLYRGQPSPGGMRARAIDVAPPPAIADVLDRLHALGLERIGARAVVDPFGRPHEEWLAAEQSGQTYVTVRDGGDSEPPLLEWHTVFADGSELQTSGSRPIAERFTFHRAEAGRFGAHGRPLPVRSAEDSVRVEASARQRHHNAITPGLLVLVAGPAVAGAVVAAICGLILLLGG